MRSAEAITIGSMSRAGTRCGVTRIGVVTGRNPPCGISSPARIAAAATARRSRSSAWFDRSITTHAPGQAIYDPFVGSGTTIIAAETCGRACHAIELNPVYVDVAVRRWQAFTGTVATLEGNGASFAEIAAERGVACDTEHHGPARQKA